MNDIEPDIAVEFELIGNIREMEEKHIECEKLLVTNRRVKLWDNPMGENDDL